MASANDRWSDLPVDPDLEPDEDVGTKPHPHPVGARTVLAVGLGGIVGAIARYAISLALPTVSGGFPWGTFLVNVTGSAVLGLVVVVLAEQFPDNHLARPLLATGVIGAYTTFSTYVVEADLLVKDGHALMAAAYVVASAAAGLAAVWAGTVAGRAAASYRRVPAGEEAA